jgi:hypothetical protein
VPQLAWDAEVGEAPVTVKKDVVGLEVAIRTTPHSFRGSGDRPVLAFIVDAVRRNNPLTDPNLD